MNSNIFLNELRIDNCIKIVQNWVSKFWRKKIGDTRKRDQRNFAKLRRMGWRVIRIWEHTIEKDLDGVVRRITKSVRRK